MILINKSHTQRGASFYLDAIIISLVTVPVMIIIFPEKGFDEVIASNHTLLTQIIIYFLYFYFSELLFKTTVGKKISGYEVKGEVTPLSVLIRTISRFIPFDAISFLLNDKRLFWHEKFSGLLTVKI